MRKTIALIELSLRSSCSWPTTLLAVDDGAGQLDDADLRPEAGAPALLTFLLERGEEKVEEEEAQREQRSEHQQRVECGSLLHWLPTRSYSLSVFCRPFSLPRNLSPSVAPPALPSRVALRLGELLARGSRP